MLPAGEHAKEQILRLVGILVFIHKDFRIPGGKLLRERGAAERFAFALHKQGERHMLDIGEIGGLFFPLEPCEFL